jgi:phage-related protein
MVETLIDNIDLIIDAGIQLILGLADGLIEALPRLIEKAPVIIQKLVDAIIRNFPKIVSAGGELIGKLVIGVLTAVPELLKQAPKIVQTLVDGIKRGINEIKNVGKYLIEGLWGGIKDKWNGLKSSVENLGKGIVNKFKDVFGIKSPSRVFRDEVGNYLAEGIGVGFEETMSDVSKDMTSAIPTEFDTNVNMKTSSSSNGSNYDMMLKAFKKALTDVKVVMNDREMATFVADTMEGLVYS